MLVRRDLPVTKWEDAGLLESFPIFNVRKLTKNSVRMMDFLG